MLGHVEKLYQAYTARILNQMEWWLKFSYERNKPIWAVGKALKRETNLSVKQKGVWHLFDPQNTNFGFFQLYIQ